MVQPSSRLYVQVGISVHKERISARLSVAFQSQVPDFGLVEQLEMKMTHLLE